MKKDGIHREVSPYHVRPPCDAGPRLSAKGGSTVNFPRHRLILTETASLWALFASSFLAATLLPGGSELVLAGLLKLHPTIIWPALAVATVGNTLGGMSSYLIGRLLPQKGAMKGLATVQKYGAPALLLSWVPIVGDPLCIAAGWLRLHAGYAVLFMAVGKLARYLVIAAAAV